MKLYAEDGVNIIHQFGTFGGGNMAAGGGSLAASSGGTTTEMSRPKWSEWTKAWIIFKKDSITGRRINGRINERRVKIWSDGRWQMMGEYATDKELFEGTLKDSIPKYYV